MGGLTWLIRMAQWARNPPSEDRVKLVLGVVALCLGIALFEWVFGWPDWLTTEGGARPVR